MKSAFELRRQIAHIGFGLAILFLFGVLNWPSFILLILFGLGLALSSWAKYHDLPILHHFLLLFERERHFRKFPARGFLFFILGAYLSFLFFEKHIAVTSIAILTFGDAFTNLIGFYFGKKVSFLNKKKTWEGSLGGLVVAFCVALCCVPFWSALAASAGAMLFEAPEWRIGKFEIDDNLIIPLVAGAILTLV